MAAMILAALVNLSVVASLPAMGSHRATASTRSRPPRSPTLHALGERVDVDVVLSSSDPLANSVRFMLRCLPGGDRTARWFATSIPIAVPPNLLALQQKYGIEAGKTEDGHVVIDAAIVMSRAKGKPFFLAAADLVDEGRRLACSLQAGARAHAHAAQRHEQRAPADLLRRPVTARSDSKMADPAGLGELASRLKKNNFDAEEVDTSLPGNPEPLKGCRVAVIAGPTQPFAADDAARIRAWFEAEGNLFCSRAQCPTPTSTACSRSASSRSPRRPGS